jgi:mevalonate pyrophosphate decarboxylase
MAVGGEGSDVLMRMVVHAMVKDRSVMAGVGDADADSAAAAAAAAEKCSSFLAADSDDSCLCSLLSELQQVRCEV